MDRFEEERPHVWVITTEFGLYGLYSSEMAAKAKGFDIRSGYNDVSVTKWYMDS